MKKYPFILYSFIIVLLMVPLSAEIGDDPLVTVHVLSKQVRLLKSGAIKRICITIKKDSIIRNETANRTLEGKSVEFHGNGGILEAYLDGRPVAGTGILTISSGSDTGVAVVAIDSTVRNFPLPMTIRYGNNDLRVYVRDHLHQYVLDSALAEYSGNYWKEKEGILALAHLIRARYFHAKKSHLHGDADFCDLTHCQVYRGRIESSIRFNDEWVIDNTKVDHNLFFHSRCGGRTCDQAVFSGNNPTAGSHGTPVRDWLYRQGITLCAGRESHWERTISNDELGLIIFPKGSHDGNTSLKLRYDKDLLKMLVLSSTGDELIPVETFRLKINRIKGWNFIRSNNFSVSEKVIDGKKYFHFRGEGLGHGVGLCQHGSMALSRMGYSRYEILEHYYPDIQFANIGTKTCRSPYCSYCLFDVTTGKVITSSPGDEFMLRTVPPGSIFKLIVALYLAAERPDIFNDYSFNCTGRNNKDANMPERCWKPKGHGLMKITDAIPNSCNLYFASLYSSIPENKFRAFYQKFCGSLGISAPLPEISTKREWTDLLAGLDFRVSFTVRDLIAIARYFYCGNTEDAMPSVSGIMVPYQEKMKIFHGLQETFTRGTAFEQKKRSGAPYNYRCLEIADTDTAGRQLTELWGKTSTVIDGTNKPESYGIFMGGNGTQGIIVILRKGTGNMASRWARRILQQSSMEE